MTQNQRAAGVTTGEPSKNINSLPRTFAPFGDLRQRVIDVARIDTHAERAGFRRGRGGRWHCAIHKDKNPSCSVLRNGCIHCWTCDESWNAIDCEMLATGDPFGRALRAMAAEYGLLVYQHCYARPAARGTTIDWQAAEMSAFNWRAGFLDLAGEMLADEKAKLFDPVSGPANESLIRDLTAWEIIVRHTQSKRSLAALFVAFERTMPELAADLVGFGANLRTERQSALADFIEIVAAVERDRW